MKVNSIFTGKFNAAKMVVRITVKLKIKVCNISAKVKNKSVQF
jgi:hypothetical protein